MYIQYRKSQKVCGFQEKLEFPKQPFLRVSHFVYVLYILVYSFFFNNFLEYRQIKARNGDQKSCLKEEYKNDRTGPF